MKSAEEFGRVLAENKINLVYGGGSRGLMGALATSALKHGGTVTGIIPKSLVELENALTTVQEMIVTKDMHERKRLMFEHSDAFVALPGGIGTLEELVEQLTWGQLLHHRKPIVCCSIDGFWEPLVETFRRMSAEGFVYNASVLDNLICNDVAGLLPLLRKKAQDAALVTAS